MEGLIPVYRAVIYYYDRLYGPGVSFPRQNTLPVKWASLIYTRSTSVTCCYAKSPFWLRKHWGSPRKWITKTLTPYIVLYLVRNFIFLLHTCKTLITQKFSLWTWLISPAEMGLDTPQIKSADIIASSWVAIETATLGICPTGQVPQILVTCLITNETTAFGKSFLYPYHWINEMWWIWFPIGPRKISSSIMLGWFQSD